MRILREWFQRLFGSVRPARHDEELADELRLHQELAAERGQRVTGAAQAMEALRDQRGLPWIDDVARDVRHGLRSLRRAPIFTAVALVTLALGIGANTAIFSILNAVILRPLPYPAADRLMRLTAHDPRGGSPSFRLSTLEYEEFREMAQSFANVGAFGIGGGFAGGGSGAWAGSVNLTAGNRPLHARSALVDEHLLDALGIEPAQGRFFTAGETAAMAGRAGIGGAPVAILSHELWQSAFDGRPIVGESVLVDGRPHDIIGVMLPGVDIMDNRTEIWLPIGIHPEIRKLRENHVLQVVGRLKDGVTVQAAEAELEALLANWGERAKVKGHVPTNRPEGPRDHAIRMQPLQDAIVADAGRAIWMLQAAVGLVLLIACANLASLVLARAESRRQEFAMRAALGASRTRLLRQTIVEGLLVAVAGGALGVWVAEVGVRALVLAFPASLPRTSEVSLDASVLLFAAGVSMATGVFFGLAPAAQRRLHDLVGTLKAGGVRGATVDGRHYLRRALVAGEVALAVMLVIGAGLLARTVLNLTRVDAGFDRSRMITFSMTLPRGTVPGGRAPAMQRLLDRLREVPGVEAATAMSGLPLNRLSQRYITIVENYANDEGRPSTVVDYYQYVMSGYFDTMAIPIIEGRAFAATDTVSGGRVAVVNETLARRLWPGRSAIGQQLQPNMAASIGTSVNPWHTVIGVAKDVKEGGVDRAAGTEVYLFIDQPGPPIDGSEKWVTTAPTTMNVALRTNQPPSTLAPALELAVRGVNPDVPVVRLREMDAVFSESIGRPRLLAQLLAVFAGLALLLAAVGTYGALAFMVAERRRDIGIRLALGAARRRVLVLVMTKGLAVTTVGIAAGVAGAIGLNEVIATLLFGVEPTDPATLITVALTIAMVAAFACWLPAWRASRVDPNIVLRAD
jgi:predicted permease